MGCFGYSRTVKKRRQNMMASTQSIKKMFYLFSHHSFLYAYIQDYILREKFYYRRCQIKGIYNNTICAAFADARNVRNCVVMTLIVDVVP